MGAERALELWMTDGCRRFDLVAAPHVADPSAKNESHKDRKQGDQRGEIIWHRHVIPPSMHADIVTRFVYDVARARFIPVAGQRMATLRLE